jgi:hypothetical protein
VCMGGSELITTRMGAPGKNFEKSSAATRSVRGNARRLCHREVWEGPHR